MKKFAAILVIFFITGLNLSCGKINSQDKKEAADKPVVNKAAVEEEPARTAKADVFSKLKESHIRIYGRWTVDEDRPLHYLVEEIEGEQKFSIVDSTGEVIYERKFAEINKVYQIFALRTENPQLVYEYNEGGGDSFIEMLDFNNDAVSELIEHANGANGFRSGAVIQPQFRLDANPAKEPFEILLTSEGLASSSGKFASILRFKDSKYQYFGRIDRGKAEDCKEKMIAR